MGLAGIIFIWLACAAVTFVDSALFNNKVDSYVRRFPSLCENQNNPTCRSYIAVAGPRAFFLFQSDFTFDIKERFSMSKVFETTFHFPPVGP